MPDDYDDATSEDDQSTEQPKELSRSHHVADVEEIALLEFINDKHRAFHTAETATGEFKLAVHIGHVWDGGWSITAFSDFLFEEPDESWWIEQPAILPPSDPEYLCERCRHIDFEWILSTPTYGSINLGPPEYTLRQENCSFCQLMACMDLYQHPPIPEGLNTVMGWDSFDPLGYYNGPKDGKRKRISFGTKDGLNPIATNESLQVYRLGSEKPLEPRILHANGLETPLLGQWIHMCEHQHKPIPSETGLGHLLLIDVDDACVVNVPASCRYTALSYVWGGVRQTQYSADTRSILKTPGGLLSSDVAIPQTIKDAMLLTKQAGIRYLWVDSICIPQDDPLVLGRLLENMGSVYGGAVVTIVDAAGSDANSGLCGISAPRQNSQMIRNVQGIQLVTLAHHPFRPFIGVQGGKWITRGWTYQEMRLSQRLLIATDKQFEFLCPHAHHCEELNPHNPGTEDWTLPTHNTWWNYTPPISPLGPGSTTGSLWSHYCSAVEAYTTRTLTYPHDILPAFAGILAHLHFTHNASALPISELDAALLWYPSPLAAQPPSSATRLTTCATTSPFLASYWSRDHRRRCPPSTIPSWTWAGWHHPVTYATPPRRDPPISAVLWLCGTGNNTTPQTSQALRRCPDQSAWTHKHHHPPNPYRAADYADADAAAFEHAYEHRALPGVLFAHPTALPAARLDEDDDEERLCPVDAAGRLAMLAFTAPVRVSRRLGSNSDEDGGAAATAALYLSATERQRAFGALARTVVDGEGWAAGSVELDGRFGVLGVDEGALGFVALSRAETVREGGSFVERGWEDDDGGDPRGWDDARLLGNVEVPRRCARAEKTGEEEVAVVEMGREAEGGGVVWDERRFGRKFYPLYNVLLVEWRAGVAYRVGLGTVHVDAFHAAEPVWGEVRIG